MELTRRSLLLAAAAAQPGDRPIDTHIHLFEPDRFPYHPSATYKPAAEPLAPYAPFAADTYRNVVIVHPEPYQDDHRYLEYCFANEPRPGFFLGTCLFDAFDEKTPARMAALVKKWPKRIVALRIHATRPDPTPTGPIRDRPLDDPRMARTWQAAHRLGLAIQMHMVPKWAPAVAALIQKTPGVRVVIDHLCRFGQGSAAEYEHVLALGSRHGACMKFSGLSYSSKQPPPHADLIPLAQRIHKAFGPDRVIWGGLGMNRAAWEKQRTSFEMIWSFLPDSQRQAIRTGNARRLYGIA